MPQSRIISFRIDNDLDVRIARVESQCLTRSQFIRDAIELLLSKHDAQTKLQIAQLAIRWE
jgi:Arc/MetJ-type ribon-helix-helix transcriptional regulator